MTDRVTLVQSFEAKQLRSMTMKHRPSHDKRTALVLAAVAGITAGLAGAAACGGSATPTATPAVVGSSAARDGGVHEKAGCAGAKGERSSCGGAGGGGTGGGGKSSCG